MSYDPKIDRRTALAWVGAAGAALAAGAGVVVWNPVIPDPPHGYGTDPNLVKPAPAPWPRLLSQAELDAAARLADHILPATATAPSASALGVPDFIDEWVSAPYPDQVKDRPLIRRGLQALAKTGKIEPGTDFFKRFRALTIGAYYTTEAGFKDIGYIGNEPRASDPGPSAKVKAVLEQRLQALGL